MIDLGSGPPVLMIPGIQGRWEWMEPAVRALADRCRVLTMSLAGEPGSGMSIGADARFGVFAEQIDRQLDAQGVRAAAVCGVSFGGLIAVHYAASRPSRVDSLVLVSTPGPRVLLNARQERFVRAPRMMAPAFLLGARGRIYPEIRAALPALSDRVRFVAGHLLRMVRAPFSAERMRQRLQLASEVDFVETSRAVVSPTLVVTGEPHLDRVVPVEGTRRYVDLIPDARAATLSNTGHVGLVTLPVEFAQLVAGFVAAHSSVIRTSASCTSSSEAAHDS